MCARHYGYNSPVLPAATAHALLLQTVWVFLGGVITQLWIEVVHGIDTSLGIYGTGPFGHVAGHIVKAIAVRGMNAHPAGDKVAVLSIVAAVGFEVGIEAAVAVLHVGIAPRELVLVLATGGILHSASVGKR